MDIVGCVVLASVSETRDQKKMGEFRAREPKSWGGAPEEEGTFWGHEWITHFRAGRTAETADSRKQLRVRNQPQSWLMSRRVGRDSRQVGFLSSLLQREPSNSA